MAVERLRDVKGSEERNDASIPAGFQEPKGPGADERIESSGNLFGRWC